jgi:hypothetical protein
MNATLSVEMALLPYGLFRGERQVEARKSFIIVACC